MEISQSNQSILNFIIPFLIAYLGSKGVFYFFSFEYSLFSDAFDVKKLLIDLGVFFILFYLGSIGVKCFIDSKSLKLD